MIARTPEEFAQRIDEMAVRAASFDGGTIGATYDLAALILERDEQVRADERARVSVVHSTLTSEQLVAELVRRGVLQADHRDDGIDLDAFPRPRYDVRQARHVTAWQPDTRTAEQRSDDAITTLRRRLGEGGTS